MKLFYCPDCEDVRSVHGKEKVSCKCAKSWSYYDTNKVLVLGGLSVPIAINNGSLRTAISNRPESGKGSRLDAFVIPRVCEQISYEQKSADCNLGIIEED